MKTIQYYQRKKRVLRLLRGSMVFLLCVIFITPFIVMISTSFRTNSDAFTKPVSLLPRVWTLDNFPAAMKVIPYWKYMGNTLLITALSISGICFPLPWWRTLLPRSSGEALPSYQGF